MLTDSQYPLNCDASCQHYTVSNGGDDYCRVDGRQANSGVFCRHYRAEQDALNISDRVEFYDGMPCGMEIISTLKVNVFKKDPISCLLKRLS